MRSDSVQEEEDSGSVAGSNPKAASRAVETERQASKMIVTCEVNGAGKMDAVKKLNIR